MKKIKYYYNTHSLRYEKLETPLRIKLLRIFGFIAAALVTAILISYLAFRFIGSPGEKLLRIENNQMRDRYKELTAQLNSIQAQMRELEKRDNEVYRTIFEADPIPDSARAKELEKQIEVAAVESMDNNVLLTSISAALNNLSNRIRVQKDSHTEVMDLINNKIALEDFKNIKNSKKSDDEILILFKNNLKNKKFKVIKPKYSNSGGLP